MTLTSTDSPLREAYTSTAEQLRDRIVALIPDHPEILEMVEAFDLFKVEGFQCKDLDPSLAQAQWALSAAKLAYSHDNPTKKEAPCRKSTATSGRTNTRTTKSRK